MSDVPPPTLRLQIDTQALASNWRVLDRLSGYARAGAAVKANCYGLGVARCLPVLREAGCRDFFVAHWSEVPAVLQHVPPEQIGVLHGVMNEAEARYASALGARPVVNSLAQARLWQACGTGAACHAMIDTGINRLGLSLDDLQDNAIQALNVHMLMSHLSSADEETSRNCEQLQQFKTARGLVRHAEASLVNGAGIVLGEAYRFDLTRPGLALYGGVPRSELAQHIRQVAFPEAAIIQTRLLKAGDSVGYNALFTAPGDMRTGVVSLGYADGFLRCWTNKGALYHKGERLPLLGRVSMDMVVVDLSAAPGLREGDWLEVPYDLPLASRVSGLSQYELLTALGARIAP